MLQITKIINAGEMKLAVVPYYLVAKICTYLEVWGKAKNGHVFPIIDRGYDNSLFESKLAEYGKQGVVFGIVIKKGGK